MKVLMFGWEYPPHVFGGLATANYGISEGLKAQGDIETVLCLPRPFGDESQHACRIVAMNAVPIAWRDVNYDYVKQRVGNIMSPEYYYKCREHIYADFNYMHVNDLGCMEFAGGYPGNLHEEINNYSIIAGVVARTEDFDIIHAHDMRASFVVSHSNGRTPFISHIHNNAFDSRGISLKSIAYLFTGLKAKHIFWVSESSYKGYKFSCFLNKKSSILYNVIDVEGLYKKMQEDNNAYQYDIIYLGRLSYEKNPQRLIKVLEGIIRQKPEIRIAVVGTGELEKGIKQLAKELKIDKNIDFLGFISNPLKILHDSKVMIMTSRWEGTPMCALEAMALGVPIVSTPVDGLRKLIVNGKNGFLCDSDTDFVDKILSIIDDKNLRLAFSDEMKNRAIKFNCIEEYKKKLIEYYEES